ncbi:hypothetical protein EWM60_15810 [Candidatus Erwinia dacicola]|nr:hypothetical protein [Candidatus Erwinia dacicola]
MASATASGFASASASAFISAFSGTSAIANQRFSTSLISAVAPQAVALSHPNRVGLAKKKSNQRQVKILLGFT